MTEILLNTVDQHLQADGKTDAETRKEAVGILNERLSDDDHPDMDQGVLVDHALEDAGVHREVRIAVVDSIFSDT
jgi:hypothetical protein